MTDTTRPTWEEIQRFQNPWTVEILNHANHQWSDFCHNAPLTLADAEKRESDLKAEHPDAKFRVVPWLNSNQKQIIAALLDENANLSERVQKLEVELADAIGQRDVAKSKFGTDGQTVGNGGVVGVPASQFTVIQCLVCGGMKENPYVLHSTEFACKCEAIDAAMESTASEGKA